MMNMKTKKLHPMYTMCTMYYTMWFSFNFINLSSVLPCQKCLVILKIWQNYTSSWFCVWFHSNGSVQVDYDILMDPSATVNSETLNGVIDKYTSETGGNLGQFQVEKLKHEGIISHINVSFCHLYYIKQYFLYVCMYVDYSRLQAIVFKIRISG